MKRYKIAPNEFLHIYNRGVNKNLIFTNNRDYYRFLFLLITLQIPETLKNTDRIFKDFIANPEEFIINFDASKLKNKLVGLNAFCLMPNHFHLILQETQEGGISKYMQRLQNAYTKYFNVKYNRNGHLFQGAYKDVLIEDNEQLLYLSSYIHKNPKELKDYKNNYFNYQWSSCQDYVAENRWGDFLNHEIISSQFDDKNSYKDFVKTSIAKEDEEIRYE